jgi:hypothetical protein
MMADLTPALFRRYYSRLEDFITALSSLDEWALDRGADEEIADGGVEGVLVEDGAGEVVDVQDLVGDGSGPKDLVGDVGSETMNVDNRVVEVAELLVESRVGVGEQAVGETEGRDNLAGGEHLVENGGVVDSSVASQRVLNASLILNVKPPLAVPKRGRPKGTGMTVLGLPKKGKGRKKRRVNNENEELVCDVCHWSDPDRSQSSGDTLWAGCDNCPVWVHQVCVDGDLDFDNDEFLCESYA